MVLDPQERFDVNQTIDHFWFQEDDSLKSYDEDIMKIDSDRNNQEVRSSSMIDSIGSDEGISRPPARANSQPISLRDKFASDINSIDVE